MAIGNRLKQLLEERGISVKEFATQIGVPPTTLYSFIKRDSQDAKMELVTKICNGLGISVNDFLEISENGMRVLDLTSFDVDEIEKALFAAYPQLKESIEQDEYKGTLLSTLKPNETVQTTDIRENKLLSDYRQLNNSGKLEAIKRVEELTEIKRYTEKEEPPAE